MIIGITGTLGAGKGTVVEILKQRGFEHFSVREFLNQIIQSERKEINRDNMVEVANRLRKENSPSYLAEQLYENAKVFPMAIIDSLRTLGEIEALRKKGKFILLAVDAKPEIRYERVVLRGSETDRVSFDEFIENERREWESNDANKQNLKACIEVADYTVENNGSFEDLEKTIKNIIDMVETGVTDYVRPSWDEYFMEICNLVGKRSTCERARAGGAGCVVVKDKQILVTGYAGSPPGCAHCDQVGHLFKRTMHETEKITNHCIRTTHAEQNAICQAAKLGIPLNGSTLYCFMAPCYICAKLIATCGIKRVVAQQGYHGAKDSPDLFKKAGVDFVILNNKITEYKNQ